MRRAEEAAVTDEKRFRRALWPYSAAAGPRETLPHRTPGASAPPWPESAGHAASSRDDRTPESAFSEIAFPGYVRTEGPELGGETDFPPPPEVLDRVLDALRKLR